LSYTKNLKNVMQCLFENYEMQPKKLKSICDYWNEKELKNGLDYKDCKKFLSQVQKIGYTFDYGLDASPFNLKKI
jgi:hypothetical protein